MKKILLLILVILCFGVSACSKNTDMKGIKNLNEQKIFEQKEDKYYVFFYRDGCSGCEDTKPYILAYIKALKSGNYEGARQIYGVNLSSGNNYLMYVTNKTSGGQGTDERFWVDGVTNWEDLKIGSTPSLITIYLKDGVKVAQYAGQGKEKIIDILNEPLVTHKK